jgi:hypothetical protein
LFAQSQDQKPSGLPAQPPALAGARASAMAAAELGFY